MKKTVLITGASTGIGRATAQYFVQQGWNVAATMRSAHKTGAWANAPNLITPYLDVTDKASIANAIEKTTDQFGAIDVVVNNAGYGLTGPLEGISADQLEQQFQTNVFGLVAVIQMVLPIMRCQNHGTIVNISSIGGRLAFPFASAYHASKFAVEGLSESLRFELKRHNIQIKLVEPGGIKTDFITRSQRWATHPAYEPELSNTMEMTTRLNDNLPGPEAVARVVYRAACDRTDKLRYPAQPGPYLLMRQFLPDRLWRTVVGMALNTHAGA
ncbi:SDR family oxidoreductase [Pseudanabaena sp. FACHB-2040]|uniref:SDR family oxidoreductase n=1 Tax=Pseudanabaena sp. FACHB-2040 TaxID=2692859 RepID=UPI0016820D1D|nr:SDR family oxidoreductase [Pseudanabaena sp. FACHB-2040]MBD2258035.1 SDR family oxidoreductase [Pseudanabaena sp. FACHB-2040]